MGELVNIIVCAISSNVKVMCRPAIHSIHLLLFFYQNTNGKMLLQLECQTSSEKRLIFIANRCVPTAGACLGAHITHPDRGDDRRGVRRRVS